MSDTRALIIVDVQNDFCEAGSLAVTGGAALASAINQFVNDHAGDYRTIVATRDHHIDPGEHFSATPDFVASWPVHCVDGTDGVLFHRDLDTTPIETVFSKGQYDHGYSGFSGIDDDGTSLGDYLRQRSISAVDVIGIATDYCVRQTALSAVEEGFATRVLLGVTAAVAPGSIDDTLTELRAAGVEVIGSLPLAV